MSFAFFLPHHMRPAPEELPSVLIRCSLKVPKVLVFFMIWVISFIPTSLSPLFPRGDAKKQYFSKARAAAPMIGDSGNERGTPRNKKELNLLRDYMS